MTISYIDGWHISKGAQILLRHGGKSFAAVMMLGLSGCPQSTPGWTRISDGQGLFL